MSLRHRFRFQNRILVPVLVALLPSWAIASIALLYGGADPVVRGVLFVLITLVALGALVVLREQLAHPFRTLSNLIEALREGDYSLRGRDMESGDVVGEAMQELNELGRRLHEQRLDALEAGMLLRKVIEEIDIAVFAFDPDRRLRLVNRAGERLLATDGRKLLYRDVSELGLKDLLDEPPGSIVTRVFPGASGRWEVRHRAFREEGRPHELLVISEMSRALREEERQTWKRMMRVLSHELNNSLTPIRSMAATLRSMLAQVELPEDWHNDVDEGLKVIGERSASLSRFTETYARLARLPEPAMRRVEFAELAGRVVSLQGFEIVEAEPGPSAHLHADPDQLEQVLINLVKNAVEAAGEMGSVRLGWRVEHRWLVVEIEDDGPGLARSDNLWVPFYSTKAGGSGIGLVLCREIVEKHDGRITLDNRTGTHGCIARLWLPRTV